MQRLASGKTGVVRKSSAPGSGLQHRRERSLRMNVWPLGRLRRAEHPRWQLWRQPWLSAFWNRAYKENITGLSGMVAYNLMLAVFPFALLVLFVFGQIVNSSDIEHSVILDIQRLFPNVEQGALQHAIDRVRASSTTIGIAAVVGGIWIGASFWGAMDTAFCRIYHVECRGWVQQKRWSLVMLLGLTAAARRERHRARDRERRPLERRGPAPRPLRLRRRSAPHRLIIGGFAVTFGIVSRDLLGRPQGTHAVAVGLAGRALLHHRHSARQLRLPPLPRPTSPTCTGSAARSASSSSPWSGSTRSAWRCWPAP